MLHEAALQKLKGSYVERKQQWKAREENPRTATVQWYRNLQVRHSHRSSSDVEKALTALFTSNLRRRRRISLHRAVVRVACVARRSIACDREKSLTHETFLRLSFQPNTVEVELSCFWPFSLVTFPLNRNLGKLVSRETGLGPGPQDRVVITWFSVFSVLSVTGFFIAISLVRLYWLVSAS